MLLPRTNVLHHLKDTSCLGINRRKGKFSDSCGAAFSASLVNPVRSVRLVTPGKISVIRTHVRELVLRKMADMS